MTAHTLDHFAMVFPGQGSQSIGMLSELAEVTPVIQETFAEASDVLKYNLWERVQAGPDDLLNQTACTQPAMLVSGVAVWRYWSQLGLPLPSCMAGHSLGEYTALVCAQVMGFTDAVTLVEQRGLAMQEAVAEGTGAMAAILGLDDDAVVALCTELAQGDVVSAVNFNSPGQVVVAGHAAAVNRVVENAKGAGARKAVLLPVSVPSHCALMKPAAEKMRDYLLATDLHSPTTPVIHNVDADLHSDVSDIREALIQQLYMPVRWVDVIRNMAARGITQLVEAGPGKVLAGLNKRIDKNMRAFPVFDAGSLSKARDACVAEPV